jgi:hypothetical protein
MAITINGTGSITGISAGGLPDASITSDDIAAGAVTAAKLAAGAGGKILNVWQGVFTGIQSFAHGPSAPGPRADITNLSVTLTPTSALSRFLITCSISMGGGSNSPAYYLMRDSTDILLNTSSLGATTLATWGSHHSGNAGYIYSTDLQTISYVDSPATASSITYKVQGQNAFGTGEAVFVNTSQANGRAAADTSYYNVRGCSTITVMEISS